MTSQPSQSSDADISFDKTFAMIRARHQSYAIARDRRLGVGGLKELYVRGEITLEAFEERVLAAIEGDDMREDHPPRRTREQRAALLLDRHYRR